MVPMAGENAVFDAAAIEWETHMRAAIVEREHSPALLHEKDRAMPAVQKEPPFELQLVEAARAHETRDHGIHRRLL